MEKPTYVFILNYTTGQVDVIDISDKDPLVDTELYLEEEFDYSLDNCHWMGTTDPLVNKISR